MSDLVDVAMGELFKYRRLGQDPRASMSSVLNHLVRPENPQLADHMDVECIRSKVGSEDEGDLFRGFALVFAVRVGGMPSSAAEAERLAVRARESYARHRAGLDGSGGAPPVTPDLQRVDALLQDQHLRLHRLGDLEKRAYPVALVAFFIFWLALKWTWWQALLGQVGVYVLMVIASLQIAGARVRATARAICSVCPPGTPGFEAALDRVSSYDSDDVQLVEDVAKRMKALERAKP